MILDRNRIIPQLWIISTLFYLLRSIAEPLKYVFILTFGILSLSYSYFLILNFRNNNILKYLKASKEFHILGIFLVIGIILSTQTEILSVKALVNFLGITFLYLVYFEYKDHIQLVKLARPWIILSLIIGLLGFLKWLNIIFELNLGAFSIFYIYGTSLVSDYNVFAIYFIISIAIYLFAIQKGILKSKLIINQLFLFLYIVVVSLTGSRRGIILLAILVLLAGILLLFKRKEKKGILLKNLACMNILVFSLLLITAAFVPFRSKIIQKTSTRFKITSSVYRYTTLFIPNITYGLFYDKLWPKSDNYLNDKTNWEQYATYNNVVNGNIKNNYRDLKSDYWLNYTEKGSEGNLFYNGDFNHGDNFWGHSTIDSIKHEIIKTEYGNALRVSRFDGQGSWPLLYKGRKIAYYKGVTYTFKFKYRVIEGEGRPFMIGWWINEGDGFRNNLDPEIRALDAGWFEFTASYTFRNNQPTSNTFMNSQHANTIIDFTDIELTSDDSLNRPKYIDKLTHLEGHNLFYNSNFENGLKFWGKMTNDTIIHRLIDTQYGKAIRVIRKEGKGYWPLIYQGRDIYYYKDLTYSFRFKFRVIEGEKAPFNIGWWAIKEKPNPYNLHKEIFPLGKGWFECIASYTFKNDEYRKMATFLNSQQENTIIDLADIELVCTDTLNRSMYADQRIDVIRALEEERISQQLGKDTIGILHERAARWKYALQLWRSEYQWSDKIFGRGFDYLDQYGTKFYPDEERIDYPHNPIISSFLYSGIIGGVFYIYFLVLSFLYYWKYRKHHILFFILYLITFTFIFISSDSHFNVPIFAMLSLVPFITKYMVKEKEQKNLT